MNKSPIIYGGNKMQQMNYLYVRSPKYDFKDLFPWNHCPVEHRKKKVTWFRYRKLRRNRMVNVYEIRRIRHEF